MIPLNTTFIIQNLISMKKLFFVLFSFFIISVNAQTVDEVIQKYAAAMGGLDAFNKVSTAVMMGTVTANGNNSPITVHIINGKALRTDVEVGGKFITSIYNNGKGWKINPFTGSNDAVEATGKELNDLKAQANLASSLMDYKNRGHQVELFGEEEVDGVKAIRVRLTRKDDGWVTTYLISTADNLLVRSITKWVVQAKEIVVESSYSNYKDIDGLKFYMTRTNKTAGEVFQEIKYTDIGLNIPVDEKIFDK